MNCLVFRPRQKFVNGAVEDSTYTPLGAMSGEEEIILSTEDHEILSYMRNYRKAIAGEVSWWEVYGDQLAVDAALAQMERHPVEEVERKVILKIELDSDFKNGIILRPRSKECSFKCERAAFAAKVTTTKVTIEYE